MMYTCACASKHPFLHEPVLKKTQLNPVLYLCPHGLPWEAEVRLDLLPPAAVAKVPTLVQPGDVVVHPKKKVFFIKKISLKKHQHEMETKLRGIFKEQFQLNTQKMLPYNNEFVQYFKSKGKLISDQCDQISWFCAKVALFEGYSRAKISPSRIARNLKKWRFFICQKIYLVKSKLKLKNNFIQKSLKLNQPWNV